MKVFRWLIPGIMLFVCASLWIVQTHQSAGTLATQSNLVLGDLDGDGDLDALLTAVNAANTLWINQGGLQGNTQGKFNPSLQSMDSPNAISATISDLDGDNDLDVMLGTKGGFEIYLNSGGPQGGWQGDFEPQTEVMISNPGNQLWYSKLGDLDNDGDPDAIFWACCNTPSGVSVWTNDGKGGFSPSTQFAVGEEIWQAALGDLDGDLDQDVWIAKKNYQQNSESISEDLHDNQVWLNDGTGHFHENNQSLEASQLTVLGDLDGNGDLDAVSSSSEGLAIWMNDGTGHFQQHASMADPLVARVILLGDLDQDNGLDLMVVSVHQAEVWLNDGQANFELSHQRIALPENTAVALGDLDSDGDLDLFGGLQDGRYRIWWNDGYGRLGLSWR